MMITLCFHCGVYCLEAKPNMCSTCKCLRKQVMCGNRCNRPAVAVTEYIGFVFCGPCLSSFRLGQRYCKEVLALSLPEAEEG